MKKYIITSLLLFIPFMSMAADHCTNQAEYTIDRRCYVTDEQKKQKPYSAVVGILGKNGVKCTGTIAKWDHGLTHKDSSDSNLYLFTAKHCTDQDGDGISDKVLHIKLQNGDKLKVTLVETGDYNINEDTNFYSDWAVYSLPATANKQISWIYADSDGHRDGRTIKLIGYGTLKIMSDKEIEEFKQKYADYLKEKGVTDMSYENTGLDEYGGVDLTKQQARLFRLELSGGFFSSFYINDLFHDKKLKVVKCFFRNTNNLCQGWNGNSGGPMIDNNSDTLVSILTRVTSVISDHDHAAIGGYLYDDELGEYEDADIPVGRIYEKIGGLPGKESSGKRTEAERVHEKIGEFLYEK
ncbi:MAG: hypothetical protein J6Y07_02070 [Alphaproteobacteria bacterium]|nr:hypothetical protein [Alphaproteobacteria bacterium]